METKMRDGKQYPTRGGEENFHGSKQKVRIPSTEWKGVPLMMLKQNLQRERKTK